MHPTFELPGHQQIQPASVYDVAFRQCVDTSPIQQFVSEDQALLISWDALLVLDLILDGADLVTW